MGFSESSSSLQLRQNMVKSQLQASGVFNQTLLEAFAEIPRELFMPYINKSIAYSDAHLMIQGGYCMASPRAVGLMLKNLQPTSLDHALILGCVSGYTAAVLSRVVASVVLVIPADIDPNPTMARLQDCTADNVIMVAGSLDQGSAAYAPYDLIVVCGAIERPVPQLWVDQLAEGGKMIYVQAKHRGKEPLLTLGYRSQHGMSMRALGNLKIPVLPGFQSDQKFLF